MKDARILTLYKQHYLDEYDGQYLFKSDYSCIGYYDGLSFTKVDENVINTKLNPSTHTPISGLWYSSGNEVMKMNGGYCVQNIGLFRYVSNQYKVVKGKKIRRLKRAKDFWEKKYPFSAIAFIKLKNIRDYYCISSELEIHEKNNEKEVESLAYCTYDNADIVLIMKSNSLMLINKQINRIETMQDILYLHSIISIAVSYLCDCSNKILPTWEGISCCLNEPIPRIDIQIVTDGSFEIIKKIKEQFDGYLSRFIPNKILTNITYSHIAGHGNTMISIPDSSVETIIALFLKEGLVTHQNDVYNYNLYNIETRVIFENHSLNKIDLSGIDVSRNNIVHYWCFDILKKLKNYATESLYIGDESLYSYMQAFIQTFNTLCQYEGFQSSRDIFYLLYSPLNMFISQFDDAFAEINKNKKDYPYKTETLKVALRRMIDCVNSVIYHTIHTDQVYLMIPGYSGTSFSIPIKLTLLYTWLIMQISNVINDSPNSYRAILTPVVESRPTTRIISFSDSNRNRLIRVKISQRFLYMPIPLIAFLCHEIGHYVGDDMRCRSLRFGNMIKTLSQYISEGLCPQQYYDDKPFKNGGNQALKFVISLKERISESFINFVMKRWSDSKEDLDYYGETIENFLVTTCYQYLASSSGGVSDVIWELPDYFFKETDETTFKDSISIISSLQRNIDTYRRTLISSYFINELVSELLKLYQEIFSDLIAICILKCNENQFLETNRFSEGMKEEFLKSSIQWKIRVRIANIVCFNKSQPDYSDDHDDGVLGKLSLSQFLLGNMNRYPWVLDYLEEYAKNCKDKIMEHINKKEYSNEVSDIRKLYNVFCSERTADNYENTYDYIIQCIYSYNREIEEAISDNN